jgi:hypothetical protein
MNDVTRILSAIEQGVPIAAGQLLPLRVKARLVELRYFAGLTGEAAAEILGISARTADRYWVYTRAWLRREMEGAGSSEKMEKIPGAGDAVSSH